MHPLQEKFLGEKGWTVECESPLEIRHNDGSFATLNAANLVIEQLRLPDIYQEWFHPDLDLTCSVVSGPRSTASGEVQNGDYHVENGAWYGRRVKDGFLCLYTGKVIQCDDSKWIMTPQLGATYDDNWDDFDDDIPF
jgi:hypothetical protein